MTEDKTVNATQGELEELNGLLVRELITKLKEGTANGTELSTASKLVIHNRIQPNDPDTEAYEQQYIIDPKDFPVQV